MQSVIFGYLRADERTSDAELVTMKGTLGDFAQANGFVLGCVFSDDTSGPRPEYGEMLAELGKRRVRYIVLPNLNHLAEHAELRAQMIHQLEYDHDVMVLVGGDKVRTEAES